MSTKRPPSRVESIQARAKRSGKSYVGMLNQETKKHAFNHGLPWDDDSVNTIFNMTSEDRTIYEIALATGRTYYSAGTAVSHVRFASRHAPVFRAHL
jgi:hypothetical protein